MEFELNGVYTLILATVVLMVGRILVNKIKFLRDFNIPEPVAGGLIAAIVIYTLKSWPEWFNADPSMSITFQFDGGLQTFFMLMFFTSIGLGADFARLKAGGIPLIIFIGVVSLFILVQDIVGVSMASLVGLDPLMGLVAGSVTLTGGHGTAGAWGKVFENDYGLQGAMTLGIAVATFGLVAGGLIGGPVAHFLIKRINAKKAAAGEMIISADSRNSEEVLGHNELGSRSKGLASLNEKPQKRNKEVGHDSNKGAMFDKRRGLRLINSSSAIETLSLFAVCLAAADILSTITAGTAIQLPTFVWALGSGVIVRNVSTHLFSFDMFDRAIDVFGNVSLSLYLAMALLSLRLWELTGLAGPVLAILAVQVIVMVVFACLVTFVLMGRNYDAAVLAAGHCGFGMGATPTAIANMQAVTDKFGPSPKSYLLVPMVGAFFVDLVNVAVINSFIKMPFLQ